MQLSLRALPLVVEGAPRARHLGEDRRGVAQELVTPMGDPQSARMPVEQLDPQIGLEVLHRFGHGTLRDRQRMRGGADRPVLGHGDEIGKLSKGEGHDCGPAPVFRAKPRGPDRQAQSQSTARTLQSRFTPGRTQSIS